MMHMRYVTNFLIMCVCATIFLTLFWGSPIEKIRGLSFSRKSIECAIEENKVLVDLDQIIKSPVSIAQNDPKLIKRIRQNYLLPPSQEPYNLAGNKDDPSMGQSEKIREILGNKKNGFFVECGALDGETRSNTLGFEKLDNWKGILIEGDPKNVVMIAGKKRKAFTVPACLSIKSYPDTVMFKQAYNLGKISGNVPGSGSTRGYSEVQCLPLYSILLAANVTTVDYFSLDVEGNELEVLRTIPWDKVDITTLSVEFIHGKEGKGTLQKYMEEQGYVVHSLVTHPAGLANDFIFVKKRQAR